MKKVFFLLLVVVFLFTLSAGIVLAGGDKVHGYKGQGAVNQYCIEPVDCPWLY
jgi:hypothetical protein